MVIKEVSVTDYCRFSLWFCKSSEFKVVNRYGNRLILDSNHNVVASESHSNNIHQYRVNKTLFGVYCKALDIDNAV